MSFTASKNRALREPRHWELIRAATGGVYAMLKIAARLPVDFPAPVLLAQHVGALPDLLSHKGPNGAKFSENGEVPQVGTIYVAPPDQHMLIEHGKVHVWRGPKVHHCRLAIYPLFRSAAIEYGRRMIGVVPTGMLDVVTAGLKAIKESGGVTLMQDAIDAQERTEHALERSRTSRSIT